METTTPPPPKPLMCRLGELLKEWKEQEKLFDAKKNDEASCTIYACSERLKEVVGEFCDDARAWQTARATNKEENAELCQPCPPSTPPRQETAAGQGLA